MKHISQHISFSVKNQSIDGTIYSPELRMGKLPAVVIYHGRGSSQDRYTDRAEALADAGFIVLIFSFRGCGDSDGAFSEQTITMGYEDTLAGYDFLVAQENVDRKRVGVYGASYGGYQAALLVQDRSVNSLIVEVPALYDNNWWNLVPESLGEEVTQGYRDGSTFADNKAIKTIENYQGPLLVIKHEFDEVCPDKQTSTFFNHAGAARIKNEVVIKGLGHRLEKENHRTESNRITVDWFKKTLK